MQHDLNRVETKMWSLVIVFVIVVQLQVSTLKLNLKLSCFHILYPTIVSAYLCVSDCVSISLFYIL